MRTKEELPECPVATAVSLIGGKWKLRIIYVLAFHEILRYGELKRLLSPITHKMLSTSKKSK